MNKKYNFRYSVIPAAVAVVMANMSFAATPDSGQSLSTTLGTKELTFTRSDGQVIAPSAVGVADADVSIAQSNITIQKVTIAGNTVFASEELQNLFSEVLGNTYTAKQLQVVAARVNLYYRMRGYPITRTLLSLDKTDNTTLVINVVEGKFAKINVTGEKADSEYGPIRFVNESVAPGFPISANTIERASLLIDDQPGMKASPIIRPGAEFGTSDLTMQVDRVNSYNGRIGWDNAGSRFTGANRLSLDFNLNSPFIFGDRLGFKGRVSNEKLKAGELAYEVPLTANGWRAELAVGKVDYHLGSTAYPTSSYGDAVYERVKFDYPIVRSQMQNLYASIGFDHKKLTDHRDDGNGFIDPNIAVIDVQSRTSNSVPLQLRFDKRDSLGGGGITYGALGLTYGRISLDSNAALVASNINTEGSYQKYTFDIARVQRLPEMFSFYARYSLQQSGSNNLDSSELIGLGGPDGVRAYPVMEGSARKGQIIQSELRYQVQPSWTGFAFYDFGHGTNPDYATNLTTKRTLSGYGLGVRQQSKSWDLDATVSWRDRGGDVTSEDKNSNPKFLARLGYKF